MKNKLRKAPLRSTRMRSGPEEEWAGAPEWVEVPEEAEAGDGEEEEDLATAGEH